MIDTIAEVVLILAALAAVVAWLSPMALRHIAWSALARAIYLDNIRAEDAHWRDYAAHRRQQMADEFYRHHGPCDKEAA